MRRLNPLLILNWFKSNLDIEKVKKRFDPYIEPLFFCFIPFYCCNFRSMRPYYLVFVLLVISFISVHAQLGVFTEFDIEATSEVGNIEGSIMETRFGILYGVHPTVRLRMGVSRLGRREIGGDYFYKYFYDQTDDVFFDESLNLNHKIVSSGISGFLGIEISPKRFLFGLDVHRVHRNLNRGHIRGNYYVSTSNTTGSFTSSQEQYRFESSYNSINFFKLNLKIGYAIYKKPRGTISLYANYAHDFSESQKLEILSVDPELEILVNSIPGGNTNGTSYSGFLNSYTDYLRDYFSVGLNVSYFFNIDVEKPKTLRVGG